MSKRPSPPAPEVPAPQDPESWPGLVFRILSNVRTLFLILLILAIVYVGIRLAGHDVLTPVLVKLGMDPPACVRSPNQVEVVDRADLISALKNAEREIKAAGCVVEKLEPGDMSEQLRKRERLRVELVMSDPRGQPVLQRVLDEDDPNVKVRNPDRNKKKILDRIERFKYNGREFLGDRLKVGVIDAYPTIEVFVVDDDLYAYPFPYRSYGSSMPIMKFKDYEKNENARPYKAHLDNVLKEVKAKGTYIENIKPAPNSR